MAKTKNERWKIPDLRAKQVAWYREHGKFPAARIVKDSDGNEYVIGDWSWNRKPDVQQEVIERQMDADIEAAAGESRCVMPKTVKVRIAVAVDPTGDWSCAGGKGVDAHESQRWASDPLNDGPAFYWVTAELPVPQIPVVPGNVVAAEKGQAT